MIRRPHIHDVPQMLAIINERAARGEILSPSQDYVCQNIRCAASRASFDTRSRGGV